MMVQRFSLQKYDWCLYVRLGYVHLYYDIYIIITVHAASPSISCVNCTKLYSQLLLHMEFSIHCIAFSSLMLTKLLLSLIRGGHHRGAWPILSSLQRLSFNGDIEHYYRVRFERRIYIIPLMQEIDQSL